MRFSRSASFRAILALRRRRAASLCVTRTCRVLSWELSAWSEPESESESEGRYVCRLRFCFKRDGGDFWGWILEVRGAGTRGGFDALCLDFAVDASRSSVEDSSRVESSEGMDLDIAGLTDLRPRSIALALGWEDLLSALEYPAAALVLDLTP